MASASAELRDLELDEVKISVGPRSYDRGRAYARGGHVLKLAWDADAEALTGTVLGRGALYEAAAFFAAARDGELRFEEGECSCPVGYNCKHVAALVIAAADSRVGARSLRLVPAPEAPPAWEQPLRALLDEAPATGTPLAIELTLQDGGRGAPRLLARLQRPGARGGWINGSLTWSGLDYVRAEYRADHLAVARELHALHRSGQARPSWWYGYGADKTVDLADCGPQLWTLLDEAARAGLALVHARPELGELQPYARGEVVLDVTRASEVRAALRTGDGDAWQPVLFLGASGHGVVCADGARLRLVRLARPAPAPLRQLVLAGEPLPVPSGELPRFAEELCPALARVAPVMSSDGSFTPPEISPPALVLHARYGGGHDLELAWEWAYRAGERVHRAPLAPPAGGPGVRDLDAERVLLAAPSSPEPAWSATACSTRAAVRRRSRSRSTASTACVSPRRHCRSSASWAV